MAGAKTAPAGSNAVAALPKIVAHRATAFRTPAVQRRRFYFDRSAIGTPEVAQNATPGVPSKIVAHRATAFRTPAVQR